MPQQQRRGCLTALWSSIIRFVRNLFKTTTTTTTPLPIPVTTPTLTSVTLNHSARSCRSRSQIMSGIFTEQRATLHSAPTVIVQSPTTMSDGSLQVIDPPPLPSPWSPIGKVTSSDVWMSVDGLLVNATGPVTLDDSFSRISTTSSSSALDALVFVSLDEHQPNITTTTPELIHSAVVTQTPRKRRETISSVLPPPTHSARTTKSRSTPLTKLDNVALSHVRSATSISSMAYEFRLGLFADGRSMTALENIISLLDQASPESILPHEDASQPVVVG